MRKRGRIDPSLPLDDIKADIVSAYKLGDPEAYEIAITPGTAGVRLAGYQPKDGDTIVLIPREASRRAAFEPIDE